MTILETHINFLEFSAKVKHGGVKTQLGRGVGTRLQPLVSGSVPELEQVPELQSPAQGHQAGPQPQAGPHPGQRGSTDALRAAREKVRRENKADRRPAEERMKVQGGEERRGERRGIK